MGLFTNDPNESEEVLESYIGDNSGPTVTVERVDTIVDMLRDNDRIKHILRVPTLTHAGGGGSSQSVATSVNSTGTAAFTQNRILIKMPHVMSNDQFNIRYADILSVAYNIEGMMGSRKFTVTTPQEKYELGVHIKIDDEEVREIVDWVDRISAENSESNESNERPPSERLNELEQLKEDGLITEDEFERKRSDIIEDL